MSKLHLHKLMLSENELDIIQTSLELTIKGFENLMNERGHNNMSLNDQFTYVDAKNLYNKLNEMNL